MTTVAKSKWVVTGSRFWTTMIATKIAKTEATMIFKLRIESKKGSVRKIHPKRDASLRERQRLLPSQYLDQ
jgi:hypothetical protein